MKIKKAGQVQTLYLRKWSENLHSQFSLQQEYEQNNKIQPCTAKQKQIDYYKNNNNKNDYWYQINIYEGRNLAKKIVLKQSSKNLDMHIRNSKLWLFLLHFYVFLLQVDIKSDKNNITCLWSNKELSSSDLSGMVILWSVRHQEKTLNAARKNKDT